MSRLREPVEIAGTSTFSSSTVPSTAARLSAVAADCGFGCAGSLGLTEFFHLRANPRVVAGLAEVKAEIAADQRARAARRSAHLARDI